MCTVVLRADSSGDLELTMNRDERRDRQPELPPRLHPGSGDRPAWIGPADSERGGTWIGVSEAGVAACLLNAYAAADLELLGRTDIPSRGEIVPQVLAQPARDAIAWAESSLRANAYPSFMLLICAGPRARLVRWAIGEGVEHLDLETGWSCVTASLWRTDAVRAWRQRAFRQWRERGAPHNGELPELNLLEDPEAKDHSPFMTRPFSATRSVTRIRIDASARRARMSYWRRRGDSMIDVEHPDQVLAIDLDHPASLT